MLDDLVASMQQFRLWLNLAFYDIKIRYRGSVLGPFWLFLSYSVFILAIGFVYQEIFKAKIETFMPYLAAGVLVWNYISSIVLEGPQVFTENAVYITSSRIPLFSFIFRSMARQLFIVAHQLPGLVLVMLYFGTSINVPLFVLGLILILVTAPFVIFPLAALGSRYRDLLQLAPVLMQLAFLITPVLWTPDLLKSRPWIYEANPLHHFISILRDPLIGRAPETLSYVVVATTGAALALLSAWLYRRLARRISVWAGS